MVACQFLMLLADFSDVHRNTGSCSSFKDECITLEQGNVKLFHYWQDLTNYLSYNFASVGKVTFLFWTIESIKVVSGMIRIIIILDSHGCFLSGWHKLHNTMDLYDIIILLNKKGILNEIHTHTFVKRNISFDYCRMYINSCMKNPVENLIL